MASLDFPGPPLTNGQVFTGGNGVQYVWNGTIWLASSMASQASDTPPANPQTNQLWFNSTLGQLFIYYTDANSSQWVPANPTPSGVPVGGGVVREVTLAAPAATIDLFNLNCRSVTVMFKLQGSAAAECGFRAVNGSTPVTTSSYETIGGYNLWNTPGSFGGHYIADTLFRIVAGISISPSWSAGEFKVPDLFSSKVYAISHVSAVQSNGNFIHLSSAHLNSSVTGATGLQLVLSTGTFTAGSFVRVIGWQ